jgi:predicted ABC-type ATPase
LTEPPFLLVIAGPNGSGKTTLTQHLFEAGVDFGVYINPDDIALTLDLPEPQRSLQAQALSDLRRHACIQRRDSFSFETVMSHPSKVEIMTRARDAGYDVTLYFVATSDPDINVQRVETRVAQGGHDVPHDRIRARYWRSLDLLGHAALVARRSVVFDNSALVGSSRRSRLVKARSGLRPVAEVVRRDNHYDVTLEPEVPQWVFKHLVAPLNAARTSIGNLTVAVHQKGGAPV